MNQDALLQLRDRLYAATGPDWELSIAIELALHPEAIRPRSPAVVMVHGSVAYNPPDHTGSIDTAVKLTPEGWVYEISQAIGDGPRFTARIWRLEPFDTYANFGEYRRDGRVMSMDEYRKALRWEPTAALALCLARVHYEIAQAATASAAIKVSG